MTRIKTLIRKATLLKTVFLLSIFAASMRSDTLSLSIADATGDYIDDPSEPTHPSPDLIGATMSFDGATGVYLITATTTTARPFLGNLDFVLNIFNPSADQGAGAQNPDFFSTSSTYRTFNTASTTWTITGVDTRLESWKAGDQVAYDSGPFGSPQGIDAFASSVASTDAMISDYLEGLPQAFTPNDYVVLQSTPEPNSLYAAGLGFLALCAGSLQRRRRRS